MDVISSLGYRGDDIVFLDHERYSFVSGRGLCINDAHGPADIIWREGGVRCYASHVARGWIAMATPSADAPIEVIDSHRRELVKSFDNPTGAEIIDISLSRSGSRMYAISGMRDQKLILWNLDTDELILKLDLKQDFKKIKTNPGDDRMIVLYGDHGAQVGLVNEINGSEMVRFETLNLESRKFVEDSEDEKLQASVLANSVTFCMWTPYDFLLIGNRAGKIVEAVVNDRKTVSVLRKSILGTKEEPIIPTSAEISSGICLVGTTMGTVFWFPMVDFGAHPAQDVGLLDCRSPVQKAYIKSYVCSLAIDHYSKRLLVGTSKRGIQATFLEIQEKVGEGDEMLEESTGQAEEPIELESDTILEFQGGAVLGAKSTAFLLGADDVVPVLISGTHLGSFSVWKHPQADAANLAKWDEIGRVVPAVSELLCSAKVGIGSDSATICSVDVLPYKATVGSVLVAFGLSTGWVEFWELTGKGEDDKLAVTASKLAARRLFKSAVVSVSASSFQTGSGPVCALAAASNSDPVVHVVEIFSTPQSHYSFDVRNTFKVETGAPSSVLWHGDSLLVFDSSGTTSQFSSGSGFCGTNKLVFPRYETSWSVGGSVVASAFMKGKSPAVVVLAANSTTFGFFELSSVDSVAKSPKHASTIVSIAASPNGTYLACGCINGALYVWERSSGGDFTLVGDKEQLLHSDAVSSLCFSADSSLVFSCGLDGSYFVYKVKEAGFLKPDTKVMKLTENPPTDHQFTTFANEAETWIEKKQVKAIELLRFHKKDDLAALQSTLDEIRKKHQGLLAENDERSDLEKMVLSEFTVDVKARDSILEENQKAVQNLYSSYERSNSLNELLAARVRAMCVDSMGATSRPLLPILDKAKSSVVTNLALRKYSEEEQTTYERARLLRNIEIRSQETQGAQVTKVPSGKRRVAWSTSMAGMPETTEWIALEGARWPCEDVVKMLADRKEAEEAAKSAKKADAQADEDAEEEVAIGGDEEEEEGGEVKKAFDDNDVFNLVYPPQAVRTAVQKRNQIVFLKEVNRLIRAKYNEHFEKLVGVKEDVLSATESRNSRIRTILSELKMEEELFEPQWNNIELAGSAIKVTDAEVVSRPYESEKDRAKRLAEDEERKRREAEKDANNVFGRALEDMMDGKLSVKKDVLAEGAMVRPAWMDELDPKDMTELQLKELEEWDDKVKAHEEEQAKYRQALQIEFKKLKQDNIDAADGFDMQLKEMVKIKGAVQKELLSQELYISRLALSMARRDQAWASLKKNSELMNGAVADRSTLRGKIDQFNVEVEAARKQLSATQEEEKSLDRGFNRNLADATGQTYDIDSLKVFKTLFRLRSYPSGDMEDSQELNAKSRDGGVDESKDAGLLELPSSMTLVDTDDPFYSYQMLKARTRQEEFMQIPLTEPLDERKDVPDNFSADQETFDALQELRLEKIAKEIEAKKLGTHFAELSRKLDLLMLEDATMASMVGDLQALREDTVMFLQRLENDVDVVACLSQGNDEVDRDAVVTDYSKCALIPTDVIDKFNSRVLDHGKNKINVLSRIKQFRRKINIIDWNAKHLTLQAKHYEEYFTDLQLLRVTRDLQSVIREGSDEAQAKARLETMAKRKDFMQKSAEIKIGKLMKFNDKMARNLKDKNSEMSSLQQKIVDLRMDVAERQSVQKSRDAARGAVGDAHAAATAKMKKVVARRQLVDTARAQAEEIDYLRAELDKMRQRTFPSFTKVKKH